MFKHTAALIIAIALLSEVCLSGGADKAKLAQIKKLVELTDARAIIQQAANSMILQLARADNQNVGNPIPDQVLQQTAAIASEVLREKIGRPGGLVDFLVGIYDKYYTSSEIQKLLSFYQSDVGRKSLSVAPRLAEEAMSFTQTWFQNNSADLSTELRRKLKEKGISLPGM